MLRSLWEFTKAVIPWVLFAIFDVLGQNFNLPVLRDFSNLELAYLIFFTILVGTFFAFHNLLSKLNECKSNLDRRNEISVVLNNLSELRKLGVAHRHASGRLSNQSQIDKWMEDVSAWRQDVIRQLVELSPAEVGLFDTLDEFKAPQFNHIQNPVIRHEMQMLYAETHRIESTMLRWMGYAD
jgi:hypothetical protein